MSNNETTKVVTSPLKAIRLKCLDCMCGSVQEVALCTCPDCSLYPFRMGKNPYHTQNLTDEQRAARAEQGRKNRAKQLEAKKQTQSGGVDTL